MQLIRVIRRPNLSVSGPTATAPIPTPIRPTVEAVVREASVNPRSPVFDRVGITAPMTTRSNPSRATATQHSRTGQKSADPAARDAGEASVLVDDEDIGCSLPREDCPCTVAGVGTDLHPRFSLSEIKGSAEDRARRTVGRVTHQQQPTPVGAQNTPAKDSDSALDSQAQLSHEIDQIAKAHQQAGVAETQPRLDYPPYRSSVLRHPTKDLHHADPETIELFAPVFGHHDVGALGVGPDHPARRRAGRRADRGHRSGARRRRPARTPPARRDLAGERVRSLHPQARPAPGADRPELHRRRPHPDRRRRQLHVHHDQARPLPVEEPPQRVAAGAHPLLAVRHRVHPADDHPDVLPGRPAVRARPDLPVDRRPEGPRAAGGDLRPRRDPARVGHRATGGTLCSPARTARRWKRRTRHDHSGASDPRPDDRPVLRLRAPLPRRQRAGAAGSSRRGPPARHGVRRGRRPGPRRAHRDLAGRTRRRRARRPRAPCAATAGPSPASAARPSTATATTPSPRCVPGPTDGRGRTRSSR